jgi:hypothetical protein
VTIPREESWLDGDEGRLVRPYTVSNGRTSPSTVLSRTSMVQSTGEAPAGLEPDHAQALALCRAPASVAEIAERLRLPAAVTQVLLSDLLDQDAVTHVTGDADATAATGEAGMTDEANVTGEADVAGGVLPTGSAANRVVLERVLDGLQRRL